MEKLNLNNETKATSYVHGMTFGFDLAIQALRQIERDDTNAGITKCLHSREWAAYLEQVKQKVLQDSLE